VEWQLVAQTVFPPNHLIKKEKTARRRNMCAILPRPPAKNAKAQASNSKIAR